MKRFWLFLLSFLILFSMVGCSGSSESTEPSTEEVVKDPVQTEFSDSPSKGLEYAVNEDGNSCTVTGIGDCTDLYVTIGASIDGYAVTAVGDSAFYCNTDIKGVKLGDNVLVVGGYAFFECTSLETVLFSDAVTTLGEYCFAGCTKLTSVSLPKSIVQLDAWAFYDCFRLEEVRIDDLSQWLSIHFGGPYASPLQCAGKLVVNDHVLTELVIPTDVLVIGSWVLAGCDSLTAVIVHENVVQISQRAFSQCENLTEIRYAGTVQQWGEIDKRSYWDFSIEDYTVFCADGEVK